MTLICFSLLVLLLRPIATIELKIFFICVHSILLPQTYTYSHIYQLWLAILQAIPNRLFYYNILPSY